MEKNVQALVALMHAQNKVTALGFLDTFRGSIAAHIYDRARAIVTKQGAPALADIFI